MSTRYGCIEAGGTKFVCAIGSAPDAIEARTRIPTTTPAETLDHVTRFFAEHAPVAAFGIGSFGPVTVDPLSPRWGHFGPTPKAGWPDADIVAAVRGFGVAVGLDTDVTAAMLGEARWGAARGTRTACYFTVGTGIGGGPIVDDHAVHGASHPEMGHFFPKRHPDDTFPGLCPSHSDCIEGLASGPAIHARWGASLSDLSPDHPAHGIIAFYVAQLAVTAVAVLAAERVVFGGGVLATPGLLDRVRDEATRLSAGYFLGAPIAERIVAAGLGGDAGIAGAMVLAERALVASGR